MRGVPDSSAESHFTDIAPTGENPSNAPLDASREFL